MKKGKVLTKEMARKSYQIRITPSYITVAFIVKSKTYGDYLETKAFPKTQSNLDVAYRYK